MSQNYTTTFDKEDDFENAFITLLKSCGWEKEVIKYRFYLFNLHFI